jgi:tetratricopeptide (TPR) repeat protein
MPSPIKVFISYSHDSDEHSARVLELSEKLRKEGIDCDIDQYLKVPPEEGWPTWMETKIDEADFVLMAFTETYLRRYRKKEVPEAGHGAAWEAALIANTIYFNQTKNKKFFPVLFTENNKKYIPTILRSTNHYLLDENFQKLMGLLKGTLGVDSAKLKQESIFNLPIKRNLFFTGREEILEDIREALESDHEIALTQAIKGLGGIGKTQIAVEYAYRSRGFYKAILWINAESEVSLNKSVLEIADIIGLEIDTNDLQVRKKAVQHWLLENSSFLLILDNIEKMDLYDKFVPAGVTGHVLITTRLQTTGNVQKINTSEMGEEGVLFLLRRSGVIAKEQTIEEAPKEVLTATQKINEMFGGLAVALEQAGAYVQETGISLSSYLNLLKSDSKKILSLKGETQTYTKAVADVFQLSLEKVDEKNSAAAELIRLCCFLDSDSIPDFIFRKGSENLEDELAKAVEDDIDWNEVVREATRFSLIERNTDKESFRIHRLAQQVIRDNLEKPEKWARKAAEVLSNGFPDPNEFENWSLCEKVLPNAHSVLNWIDKFDLEVPGRAFACAGFFQYDHGAYFEAEIFFKKALDLNRSFFGEEHLDVASSLNNLAVLYKDQGRNDEAEPLYLADLKMSKKLLGEEHPEVATSLGNLAELYRDQGRYDEAELFCREALEMSKKLLGAEHPFVAECLNNLAELYGSQGRYDEVESLWK